MKTKTKNTFKKCKIGKIIPSRGFYKIYKVVNTLRDHIFYLDFRPSKHDFKVICMKEYGWDADCFDELQSHVFIERIPILTYKTDW